MPAPALATASLLLCALLVSGDPKAGRQPLKVRPRAAGLNNRFIVKWKAAAAVAGDPASLPVQVHAAAGRTRVQMAGLRHDVHSQQSIVRLAGYTADTTASELAALLQRVAADPGVEYIVEDRIMHPSLAPNDPLYASQWHYRGVTAGGTNPSGLSLTYGLNLPDAWARTTGAAIPVAIVDTGITSHPDLDAKVLPGYDMVSPDGPGDFTTANDGDGRDPNPADPGDWTTDETSSWHGTHVAGTIGAATNNSIGVAGVSWGAKLLPVRALGSGGGYSSDINDGIRWAAGLPVAGVPANPNPARVINLSLGGDGACDAASQDAIDAATSAGAIVVVAAGNENQNTARKSPCNCQRVICVAAHGPTGQRTWYSNVGPQVDITAPGGDSSFGTAYQVESTWNSGTKGPGAPTYDYMQGTSMATPHISGLVALMLSLNPNLVQESTESVLRLTARAFPAPNAAPRKCSTSTCGGGLADAAQALAFVAGMPPNDCCPAAIPIGCGQLLVGSVQNATAVTADAECGGTAETTADVWYSIQLSAPTALRLSTNTATTNFDTQINVYAGSCSSLSCVAGQDNGVGTGLKTDLTYSFEGGYRLIRVSGRAAARGSFSLQVTCSASSLPSPRKSPSPMPSPSPAPGGSPCQAQPLTCNAVATGSTQGMPSTLGALACNGVDHTSSDRWFSLTPPGLRNVTVSTVPVLAGPNFDTKLSVFGGNCNALTCLGSNDDFPPGLFSRVTISTAAPLFIMVHGYMAAAGNFRLNVTCV